MFEGYNGHKNTYELGHSFNQMLINRGPTVPRQNELELYNAIHQVVIEDEVFYSKEVRSKVIALLGNKINPEELTTGHDRVEGGHFGMIIYYMRKVVEQNETIIGNKAALKAGLDSGTIFIGLKIKNTSINAIRYSTLQVLAIDEKDGSIQLVCSRRGTNSRQAYWVGANSPYVQDFLKKREHETGITVIKGDGITTTIIDPSAPHRAKQI